MKAKLNQFVSFEKSSKTAPKLLSEVDFTIVTALFTSILSWKIIVNRN
jgi:hypothetical protein